MKAIILSAGQGKRLMPLTEDRPKCLIDLSGRTLLEWQIRGLAAAGVTEAVIVTGFRADRVEEALAAMDVPGITTRTLYNPFYALADNTASCWVARAEMEGPFLILNGDTLFEPEIARRLLAGARKPITVTIDAKDGYDADDMKVRTDADGNLQQIGKTLPLEIVNGESIGFLCFTAEGGKRFAAEVERTLRTPEGLRRWYLSVIDTIAKADGSVGTVSIQGLEWGEMDFPADVDSNRALTAGWTGRGIG
ncbi:phosphocholine cytidylyltransferase family protein [Niveispirillum sp.]|uniref:phosphocholine cytidylyltransferase family protein n=1 Tax=Niveispirillum sp. TaxID=1917217 RepID=UPI001B785B76|nr:phosphocholine cytidylyltransferase family protein [Niveispirillum sp.]MBP7336219.1 phosphocholine cytidylyltransferase family protein [Niveispirillum sp.]